VTGRDQQKQHHVCLHDKTRAVLAMCGMCAAVVGTDEYANAKKTSAWN
jgi:hypothetical protein